MQKRVSLKDIAKQVGVSVALVSYVLNGQEKEKRVGAEVVKKIWKVAKELNYQPNQIARSLRMKSTMTIGLIVTDIANPFFGHMARILENEAANRGYTLVFGSSEEDRVKSESLINTLQNRQVDGFIIVPAEDSMEQIQNLITKNIPVVLVDRYFPEISTSHVVLDNYRATFEATLHLINEGYRQISMVAYKSSLIHMKERIRGYREAMESQKLSDHLNIIEVRYNQCKEDIEDVFNELQIKKKNTSAVLFATNALSICGMYCVQKKNLKIPEDIALFGFDGGESFDLFSPPLSFVQQPLEEMTKEAFNVLMSLINGSRKITQIMLSPTLVIRKSNGSGKNIF